MRSIKSGLDATREKGKKLCIPNTRTILVDTLYSLYYVSNTKGVVQISFLKIQKSYFKSNIREYTKKKKTPKVR